MGSLAAEPKLPTSPSAAPESPTTEVTKSARLIVNMKRELMELIKAEHYETALTICDRRTCTGGLYFDSAQCPVASATRPSVPFYEAYTAPLCFFTLSVIGSGTA